MCASDVWCGAGGAKRVHQTFLFLTLLGRAACSSREQPRERSESGRKHYECFQVETASNSRPAPPEQAKNKAPSRLPHVHLWDASSLSREYLITCKRINLHVSATRLPSKSPPLGPREF